MIVATTQHAKEVMKDLYRRMCRSGQYDFSIDTETQPKHPYTGKKDALIIGRMEIIIFSICHRGISYSFPTDRFLSGYPSMEEWADVLRPYVEDKHVRKVMHNANYDLSTFMTSTTLDTWNNVHCTMIGAWLAREYVEKSLKERAPFYGRYIQKTAGIEFTDLQDLSTYAEMDVVVTDELYQMQVYGKISRPCMIEHLDDKCGIVKTKSDFAESLLDGKKLRDVITIVEGESLTRLNKCIMSVQEIPAMRCNVRAELLGFPINRFAVFSARKKLLRSLNDSLKSVYRTAGRKFNLRSTKQLAEVMTGLGVDSPVKSKKTGSPSFSAQALVKLAGTHSIIDQIQSYKDLDKMMSVYIGDGDKKNGLLEYTDPYDKIHCTINSVGAVTGRASCCVAPSTLIETEHGKQQIAYIEIGTRVWTHKGRLRPVLQKYYKGLQPMFRYYLSNGGVLEATEEHRVLVGDKFLALAKCSEGDTIASYVSKQNAIKRRAAGQTSSKTVHMRSKSPACGHSRESENHISHSHADNFGEPLGERAEETASVAVFGIETGREESDERKIWEASPQLQRGVFGLQGLSHEEDWRSESVCSPSSIPKTVQIEDAPERVCCASYRQESTKQQIKQFSTNDFRSAQEVAFERKQIIKIEPIGFEHVWDIHVEEDESYLAGNFVNHNSAPNLQQLPSRKDTFRLKDCFVSTASMQNMTRNRLMAMEPDEALAALKKLPREKREVLLCLDYSQLEIRVMALLCKDPLMTEVLCDPKGDIHQTTADHFGVPRNPAAKNLNFLLLYGGQEYMLSEALSFMGVPTTKEQAAAYIRKHTETYPNVVAYRKWLLDAYKEDGFVEYFTGRTRTLEQTINWGNRYEVHKAETTLSNNICQGCLTHAQKLLTKDGSLPIVEIMRRHVEEKKNQKIWSGNRWERITDVFSVGKKQLYEVELSDGSVFETSDTHLWKNELGEWVKTAELSGGDFIQQSCQRSAGIIRDGESLKEAHAELVGMFLGDGCYSGSDMRCVVKKAKDIEARQRSLLHSVFNDDWTIHTAKATGRQCYYVRQVHRRLFREKIGMGYARSYEKEVPDWIFSAPQKHKEAFICGYYLTDGGTALRAVQFTSVSKELLSGTQKVLYSLGIASNLKSFKARKSNERDYWRLYLAPQSRQKFASIFNSVVCAKADRLRAVCVESQTNKGEFLPPRLAKIVAEEWHGTFSHIKSPSKEYYRRRAMLTKLRKGKGSLWFARQLPLSSENKELVSKSYLKVVRVTNMRKKVEMFDLTVKPSHQYAAWNGAIMHNSGQDFVKAAIIRADYRGVFPDKMMLDKERKVYKGSRDDHFDMINEQVMPRVKRIRSLFMMYECRYLLQVHDEVIFTVDVRGAEECLKALGELMCLPHYLPGTTNYTVPLAAEGGIGLTWKQAKGGDAFKTVEARMDDKYLSRL